jgi:hypothetical protein
MSEILRVLIVGAGIAGLTPSGAPKVAVSPFNLTVFRNSVPVATACVTAFAVYSRSAVDQILLSG